METTLALPDADVPPLKLPRAKRRGKAKAKRPASHAVLETGVLHGNDMGAPLAIARGIVEPVADDVVPLDPDSKRSLMRVMARAHKVWAPDNLLRTRTIEQNLHDAAARYFDDFLIGELGARRGARGHVRTDPWNRCLYSEQRAMRRQSFQFATRAVGPASAAALVWCVLQLTSAPDRPPTVKAWAESQTPPWPTTKAVGYLIAALDRLAEHYGYSSGRHPTRERQEFEQRRREREAVQREA